jgi:hypothetical protein
MKKRYKLCDLRCIDCGSSAVIAVNPGREPVREGPTRVLTDAGSPTVARCLQCLLRAFPALKVEERVHG